MSKKKEESAVFTADLEMTRIHSSGVTFRVVKPEGVAIEGLHHVIMDRKFFPKDDNFSMDFMNSDIQPQGNPRKHTEEYKKTIADLQEKQAAFNKFRSMKITVTME